MFCHRDSLTNEQSEIYFIWNIFTRHRDLNQSETVLAPCTVKGSETWNILDLSQNCHSSDTYQSNIETIDVQSSTKSGYNFLTLHFKICRYCIISIWCDEQILTLV